MAETAQENGSCLEEDFKKGKKKNWQGNFVPNLFDFAQTLASQYLDETPCCHGYHIWDWYFGNHFSSQKKTTLQVEYKGISSFLRLAPIQVLDFDAATLCLSKLPEGDRTDEPRRTVVERPAGQPRSCLGRVQEVPKHKLSPITTTAGAGSAPFLGVQPATATACFLHLRKP
jgi:hypothetical protein